MQSLALLYILVLTILIPTLAAAQWSVVNDPGTFDGIEIFLPHEDGLYMGTFQGQVHVSVDHGGGFGTIWSSPDFGDSWEQITGLPTDDNINGMALTASGIAIGASGSNLQGQSIWVSDDFVTWENYTGNLGWAARAVNELVTRDGWFFKTGGTVTKWHAPHAATTSVAGAIAPAMQATLSARPNPFNPATRIDYTIAGAEHVRLTIHDPQGRLVALLVDGPQAAGEHAVSWNARDTQEAYVSSGVYLVRLRAGSRIESDKLVLAG